MNPNTNRDHLYYWAIAQEPIRGLDHGRGHDGRGRPSQIEDSILRDDRLVYINPLVRVQFFTAAQADAYRARLVADLGEGQVGVLSANPNFDTSEDPFGRTAYYIQLAGELVSLNRLRYLASTGKDLNGNQIYDDATYTIKVDGPGTFTLDEDGALGFIPKRKAGQ